MSDLPEDQVAQKEGFDPENLTGKVIANRYLIEKCIGRGGMGSVYLGSQSALNRKVVIKVLRSNLVEDDEAIARFEREAQGLSALHHPNVVTIYDFGRDGERAFIAMEYVEGETLSRYIRREGPMPIEIFSKVAAQILQGIGEAHSLGLLHRDIKPANIMLCERHGHKHFIKILDFGLAKLASGQADVTREQSLVGSAAFLSPEQIVGMSDIDQRVDVYALGVLFYYMLSGKRPFTADNDTALLYKHVHEAPEPLHAVLPEGHNIPASVIQLIHQCLAKNPRKRPADANDFLDKLTSQVTSASKISLPWTRSDFTPLPHASEIRFDPQTGEPVGSDELFANMGGRSQSISLVRMPDGNLQVVPIDNSSTSYSRSILQQQPPKRSPLVPILITAILLLGVGIGAYAFTQRSSSADAASASQAEESRKAEEARQAEEARKATEGNLIKSLDNVQAALDKEEFNQARKLLSLIDDKELRAYPDLSARFVDYQSRVEQVPQDPLALERDRLAQALDHVSEALDSKEFGQARLLIGLIDATNLIAHPDLGARLARYQSQINEQVSTQLASARKAEAQNDVPTAIQHYSELLALDPKNAEAQSRINSLLQAQQAARVPDAAPNPATQSGFLTLINAPKGAFVFLDGKQISDGDPIKNHALTPGIYKLKVTAKNYEDWEGDVTIAAGMPLVEVTDLKPKSTQQVNRPKPPTSKPDTKPTDTTTKPADTTAKPADTTKPKNTGIGLLPESGGGVVLPSDKKPTGGGLLKID
jgi:eukaryotic-like serine/threonine-protein kinase